MTRLTRRSFLKWTGIATATAAIPAGAGGVYLWTTAGRTNVGKVRFERPLAIPPLAEPARDDQGRLVFDLAMRTGEAELRPGAITETWGINGPYLGPTLRARRGDTVLMRVHNHLPEPTTLHWHGMELPAIADGGPHQMIAPDSTWTPEWTIDQPAATLWYHPHPHGATKEHVYRGLAGLFLVDDGDIEGLPHEYGVDDIPLIVQDKHFKGDGALDFGGISFGGTNIVGLLGSEILVNGTWGPVLDVRTERVRLRTLNASNARVYDLGFDDGREFHLAGTDAGLLPAPVPVERVRLSPGERVELVVAMRPGETALLVSRPPDLGANVLYDRFAGGDDAFELLQLRAAPALRPSPPVPASLPAAGQIVAPPGAVVRTFALGDFTINGSTMDMERIDFVVPLGRLGSTEIWEVTNDQAIPHNFHVHNAAFAVIAEDGERPSPDRLGRKDTVFVPPGSRRSLAITFGPYADPTTPYMVHCHLLAHEDAGMMQQFLILAPGMEPGMEPEHDPAGALPAHAHG